jgi:hypothetical protein
MNKTAEEWIDYCEYIHDTRFSECPFCEMTRFKMVLELLARQPKTSEEMVRIARVAIGEDE